ncbi:AAA family ATPase [Chitinibacter fontanus]|uniref:AAA family ATPase n=1 Tax=Chitinibacter fontanus TaxID=1737446 RepID=A0A7D5VAN7_9NEIS|nr:AAA family ATPase [Chitinibacter fontanus]QLI81593.1 AAA family ATPase [Chitinibacter fontanus]
MLNTLAIANYRSLRELIIPLGQLNVITGANGSGKSSLYRALRLLAESAQGRMVASLAQEGGFSSTLWAGPETISRAMKRGDMPIQGTKRQESVALKLGFAADDFGYAIDLGLPTPDSTSLFGGDPHIKRECIWAGAVLRESTLLADRDRSLCKVRAGREWQMLSRHVPDYDSLFSHCADPLRAPEVLALRERMRAWRFYDCLRSDAQAPARQAQIGTYTPVLAHDGADLAAALQTIRELGRGDELDAAVDDAFPGARVEIVVDHGRFSVQMWQNGLLRPLAAAELSDGTLRYLLLVAALLSPRPPELLVLNEPETSLHPDLLPALARLITSAGLHSQIIVVSHAARLVTALSRVREAQVLQLAKELGATQLCEQTSLDRPAWQWPKR